MNILDFELQLNPAPLQRIELSNNSMGVNVFLKREDLLHPIISGNKWRKLKYNLIEAKEKGLKTLLTFGGAYSNHIHATAYAGKLFEFKTIGIIRGEEHLPWNPTIEFAKSQGMEIHYIDRKKYRHKHKKEFLQDLRNNFEEFYLLPEGGTNLLAVKGCSEIIEDIDIEYDYIVTACGTGGTIAGLICGLKGRNKILGIPVLKGADFLLTNIDNYVKDYCNEQYNN
jgi:1-aminocyclopropane-1-carboxylate deaminase/D-cysteine desulfhydrase-like pyridoxal-dependent ACC family enzyme